MIVGMVRKLTRDPAFLLFVIISYCFVPLQFVYRCYPKSVTVYFFVASCCVSTFLWIFVNLFKEIWSRKIKTVLVWSVSFYGVVNAFVWEKFENIVSPSIIDILSATNAQESKEFCSSYLTSTWVFTLVLIPIAWTICYIYVRRYYHKSPNWYLGVVSFLILSGLGLACYSPVLMKETIIGNLWNFSMDDHVDLHHHLTHPKLIETREDHPEKIVVIIGESFSKSHSSLYGYSKDTNPKLTSLENAGDLIVFSSVTSPAPGTLEAFRQILGTYNDKVESTGKKWYDCSNIIEMVRTLGYCTRWASNQSNLPMFDDVCSTYASFCDESHFNKEDGSGYDEYLLQFDFSQTNNKDFVVYHLMGQHGKYAVRFPQTFAHFSYEDYSNLPVNQRQVIADYDNATRYNDTIVHSLMTLYASDDAIVFYFPDHGQDLFETDSKNYGHGRYGNPESVQVATQIPFVVYANDVFRERHSGAIQFLSKIKDIPLNTTTFYKLVLEVMGYHLEEQ